MTRYNQIYDALRKDVSLGQSKIAKMLGCSAGSVAGALYKKGTTLTKLRKEIYKGRMDEIERLKKANDILLGRDH